MGGFNSLSAYSRFGLEQTVNSPGSTELSQAGILTGSSSGWICIFINHFFEAGLRSRLAQRSLTRICSKSIFVVTQPQGVSKSFDFSLLKPVLLFRVLVRKT